MARVASCLVLSWFATRAFAQEPAPEPEPSIEASPEPAAPPAPPPLPMTPELSPQPPALAPAGIAQSVLPQLWATSAGATIELRVDYSDLDSVELSILNILTHVQYVTPQGMGGYVELPFGYVEDDPENGIFSFGGSGIGNLEIGGLYVQKMSPRSDVLVRAGVAIDTADEDSTTAIALSTLLPRLVDTYATGLETTWGRAQAQIRHANQNLRLGAAVGFDAPVAGEGADQDGFTGVVTGIVSIGMEKPTFGLGLSLTTVQPISDGEDDNLMGLNLGADFAMSQSARLFFQLGFSLEDESDGTSFGMGFRATM